MLPGMSGLDVCRELRAGERTRDIPIIMLTARAEETDQVVGFSMGADDYVTKPFSTKVLLQRIKALQRRAEGPGEPGDVIEHLGVRIDRVRHRATVGRRAELDLTPTEFRLLECLLRQPGRAFTRHQLMDAAIGEGAIVLERTIDVHVKTLRQKLRAGGRRPDRDGPRRRLPLPRDGGGGVAASGGPGPLQTPKRPPNGSSAGTASPEGAAGSMARGGARHEREPQ